MGPDRQKPQCIACSTMKAVWMGCGLSTEPRPSIVVTLCPSAFDIAVTQERIGTPSRSTVQAPHCARPQPNFGPFNLRIVLQHVQQWGRRIYIHRISTAVNVQADIRHSNTCLFESH